MRRLIDHTVATERETIDGVRINLGNKWIMVAPDRRQASFYLVAEAPTQDGADDLVEEYRRLVLSWRDVPDGMEASKNI